MNSLSVSLTGTVQSHKKCQERASLVLQKQPGVPSPSGHQIGFACNLCCSYKLFFLFLDLSFQKMQLERCT